MTTLYTPEVRAKLEDYLSTHDLPRGLGDEESACSIAAINLALTGDLTDDTPVCMSEVLGRATIALQDAMPADQRNSDRYKAWLPTAAGTGRDHEQERLAVLMDWMWDTVLPQLQGLADERGFGKEWRRMCEERTVGAADDAAVHAAAVQAAEAAAEAAGTAAVHADAAVAAEAAAEAAEAAGAASAAAAAVHAAAVHTAVHTNFWQRVDPIGVLERMTKIGED
jgi:hypothetical protein